MSEEEDCADDAIQCPFCGKEECRHLVASFDHENAQVGGGVFSDRESELLAVVMDGCEAVLATHGESITWKDDLDFEDVWKAFIDSRAAGHEDPMDAGIFAHLLDNLLRDTDAISEEEGSVVAFYDRHPQVIYEQVVARIRKACAAARASP